MTASRALTVRKQDSPPMAGDPQIDRDRTDWFEHRRRCQYAAGILKKRGKIPEDASHLIAMWRARDSTVVFATKDMKFVAAYERERRSAKAITVCLRK